MLNVYELETKWRKYKIKSYIPYIVIALSLGVISTLIYTIYNSQSKQKSETKIQERETKNITIKQKEHDVSKITQVVKPEEKKFKEKSPENKKIILSPSLGFMSEMKHNAISYYENDKTPVLTAQKVIQKPKVKKQKIQQPQPVKVEEINIEEVKKQVVEDNSISIKRQNTQEDISHVIKRFKKNNNPALSLFVAKKYYELGEYHKSYNYALITNEINDNIDASWIIFAKSLVKLNEKDEAMKILKKYIEYSHSSQAKILLEEISSGKFK